MPEVGQTELLVVEMELVSGGEQVVQQAQLPLPLFDGFCHDVKWELKCCDIL